ncbi:efflux transporter outer membrane subunit [Formosa sp. S-31]|uniref:efflux transporter outer membrane subunit n=1 Tax=Formosa sp. S-31 TaxID=2790949 RepID=UPI003EBFE5E2
MTFHLRYITLQKVALVLFALVTFQSCFVAKNYERPEIPETDTLYRTDNLPADSVSMAQLSWKEVFTDPVLQQYIEKGLENNIDVRVALQQIRAAEAYAKQGKAGYYPTVDLGTSYTYQKFSPSSGLGQIVSSIQQFELSSSLSWEADIWGKIRSTDRASQASYLQTVAAHQAIKTQLISDLASVYYQIVAIDEQTHITEQTIKAREKRLEASHALKESGDLTEVAIKQTEAQLYTAQALLVDLNLNARILENTFSILLGESPTEIERNSFEAQEMLAELKTGVPYQLLSNRPDVIAAEQNFRQAFELTNVAKSNFYPALTIGATGGFQSTDFQNFFDANSLFANILGGLTQPLFNGRKIKTQYEVSQAQQEEALLRYKQSILVASKEVSDALYSYQASEKAKEIRTKEYEAYTLAKEYSAELLTYGLANYLEVITAEENELNSSLGLTDARYNKVKSIIDLYKALGGGWQ